MTRSLARVRKLAVALWREVVDDRVTGLAAEMAFYAVLGIFPAVLLLAAGLGWLDSVVGQDLAETARRTTIGMLNRMLTDRADEAIGAVDQLFVERSTGILTGATAAAIWAVSRSFSALIRALNIAYSATERRSWWRVRAMALAMGAGSIVVAAVLISMVIVGPLLGGGRAAAGWLGLGDAYAFVWRWVRIPVSFVVLVVWATTVLHVSPSRRRRWLGDVPGALLAAVSWLLASWGFSVYLRLAGAGNEIYGVLGGGLVVLMWLYLLSVGLLVGGELNEILERDPPNGSSPAVA